MAAGDHHTRVDPLREQRKIQERGRNHPNIQDIAAAFSQAADHDVAEARGAFARVAANAWARSTVALKERSNRPSEIVDSFIGEVSIDDSSDVILPENILIHRRSPFA